MTATPEYYRELRRHIHEPLPRLVPPDAIPVDGTPPDHGDDARLAEDADWPAPTDYASVVALMRRFDPKSVQRVLCAVTAVESVLPVWEAELEDLHDEEHRSDLRGAIDGISRWIRFRQAEDVRAAAQFARRAVQVASGFGDRPDAADAGRRESALNAADAVDQAAEATWHLAHNGRDNSCAAGAVWRATVACCGPDDEAARVFLRRWWAHCRRRLAWADASTSEIRGESWRRTAVPDQRP